MSEAPVAVRPSRGLGSAQQVVWTGQRAAPDVPLANMATLTHFDRPVDAERLADAFARVVESSDALRTVVHERQGVPVPTVCAAPPGSTEVIELGPGELADWVVERVGVPLDLATCGYDSVLLRLADGQIAWYLCLHHVITDATSSSLVYRATAAAYEGRPFTTGSYREHLRGLEYRRQSRPWRRAAEHWAADEPEPADPLALFGPRRPATTRNHRTPVEVGAERRAGLERLLAGELASFSPDLTRLAFVATCLAVQLHRVAGLSTMRIGIPIHHRGTDDERDLVGLLMELYPITVAVGADDTFRDVYDRALRSAITTLRRAEPGAGPRQDFEVVLNLVPAAFGPFGTIGARTEWVHSGHVDAEHRLRCQVYDFTGDGRLRIDLDISEALADVDERQRMVRHFGAVLDAFLADPDASVGSFPVVDEAERAVVVEAFNDVAPHEAPAATDVVPALRARGSEPAVSCGAVVRSGDQLADDIDALAVWLHEQGIGPGDRVGIEMRRSIDAVVAIHGVLRVGAAFCPIDPELPAMRRAMLIEDLEPALVLDGLPELAAGRTFEHPPTGPDALAYVLFTSGSTGRPKGVPITHRGLSHYLGFALEAYVGDTPPVVALHSSLSFDLTITSLFLPLLAGGELSVIEASAGEGLRRLVDERRVTLLKATPSHLELLVRMLDGEHALRTLVVGGEAFGTDLADRLLAVQPELEIFNEYGPTEGVVGCMVHRYDPSLDRPPEVPIGRPAPGCSIVVRDPYGHPTPLGASGELHLRRPGMAEGYWRRPDLDQGRFVADGGLQWYRTGDRVRLLDPHTMVYEGRLDEQLKLGAVRVEPGEIEAALNAHPDIEQSVVRVWSPASGDADHPACVRCGLSTEVPGVGIDDDGVCSVCREYDTVAEQAERYFGTPDDLCRIVAQAGAGRAGDYDCLHLLSGGKDSTYALYQLVEMGLRVRALTLDNGFISDGAKANVARAVSDLGVDHEFVTTEAMNEVFRDSLERYSNVCNGCFKVLYTLAVGVADRHDIPVIVTGLSRGQFFETRLTPAQFRRAGFDPAAVDATVLAARKAYHREHDAVAELLDTSVFATDDVFDRIRFVDFYRYTDVELDEMLAFLDERAPWVRPADTGRSTNCLVNAAGIHVHRTERGFHNYALPYSWDVRLGHKTRAEAVDELDDPIVADEVAAMLAEIGYVPRPTEVLTAWYVAPAELDPADLRRSLARVLPAHSIPTAFVRIDAVPLTANGKVAPDRLLAPTRTHRIADGTEPETETERLVSEVWAGILGLDQVGVTTPFFDLGGTSLRALEMIVAVADRLGIDVPERLAFEHRTVRDLAVQLDDLLREGGPTTSEASTTPTAGATPALSVGEEAMLFHARRHPGDVRYNVTRLYDIEGALDAERLEAAVRQVVARHHTLRTSYADDRHEIDAPVWVQRRALARDDELAEWADDLKRRPFDLDAGPLVRLGIVRRSGERWAVLIGVPHIVADAGALDVFWDQVAAVYQGDELAPLPVSYAEVGVRQRRRHEHDPGAARFWAEQLDGRIDARPLAIEGPRRATPDGYVERPLDLTASQLAEGPGRTAFTTALAALAVVLARHGRGARPGIAITASTRDGSDTEPLVGYFLNPLPLGVQVGDEDTFAEVCRSADAAVANSLPHRTYPHAWMVRDARADDRPEPATDVMLAFEELAPAHLGGASVTHRILAPGTAVTDLTAFVQQRGELVEVGLEYAGTVFDADAAARFLDLFADTLVRGWAEPDLTPAQLVPGSPRVGPPIGRADRIPDLVDDQPTAAEAVRSGAEARSYGELRRRRDQIAERLHALSVGRGDRVALLVGRSTDAVAAALAIWHVGASYVPIDASQPAARIERLLGDAAPALVITDRAHHAVLAPVCLDLADVDDVDPSRVEPVQGDEAYVIFTSGSTGEPKGVVVSHANLATSTAARASFYAAPPERFVMVSSLAFDSSMVGLWWTLSTGGEVVLPTDDEVHDVDQLGALFERAAPSHTLMVPTLYGALLDRAGHRLAALDTVIVAGEACPTDLVTRHHRQLRAELVNEYGPSEATVWATAHRCRNDEGLVPIGGPIAGVTLMVADERSRPVPDGVTGELWIGGPTVAGYLHGDDPAFAERHGGRWYRTGDRVRARPGVDELVFLGRVDDQLSLGGRRVEPAEIEQALTSVHGVHHAVVGLVASAVDDPMRRLAQRSPADAAAILREAASAADPIAALGRLAGSRPVLVAHVETAPGVDGERIRRAARELLPDPLVPRHVRVVDALPRTANGKIDRDAVELSVATSSASAPPAVDEGARREMLAAWRKVFGDDTIDAHSDFFELGGDSLLAVGLAAELEAQLGRRVPINLLIEARTPSALAAALGPGPNPDGLLVPLRRAGMATPLVVVSPGGGNLLTYEKLISRLDPDVPVWGLRLPGAEGREAPATSMDELVDRFGAELRGQFAHRPLRLLGYSTGGLVAYELATRWRDEGADIEQLVLVDTVFPGRLRDVHAALRREWQDKLVWYGASAVAGVVYDGVRRRVQPRLADVLRRRAARRGRSAPAWANELHMHEVAAQIAETYRPGPYGGPTLLIRASQTDPALTETPWVELLDDVRVEVVPGRHYGDEELLTSDSVDDVAGALDRLS